MIDYKNGNDKLYYTKQRDIKLLDAIWIDPRTKIVMLIICIIAATNSPSLTYNMGLVTLIALIGILFKKYKYSISLLVIYLIICKISFEVSIMNSNMFKTSILAFLGLFHKVYACGMLSGIIISTTKVSEFLSAMNKMHIPKKVTIPLAVMLRYIPTIQEDWRFIKDAMRMRGISPNIIGFIKNPIMTIECIYVPLMMAASKAADELSIAAITRGIENPKKRTCLIKINIGILDIIFVLAFLLYLLIGIFKI